MRINAFSDVCLRVLMILASSPHDGLQTSRVIAAEIDIPYNHVSKAVIRLRDEGLVDVVRGRSGGLRITEEGKRVSVGAVLRSLDTRTDVADCRTPKGDCPLLAGCGLRVALARAREAFYAELDGVVIADLAGPGRIGSAFVDLQDLSIRPHPTA